MADEFGFVEEEKKPNTPTDDLGFVETPTTLKQRVGTAAMQGLQGFGKALDVVGAGGTLLRPALAMGLGVYNPEEHANSIDPRNLNTFPVSDELFARAGVPVGGTLSDAFPQAFSPTGDEWTKFKKGGLLDMTVRGTAGGLTDMLLDTTNLATLGAAGSAKKALLNPISGPALGASKSAYRKGILPLAQTGEKFGKEIPETFFKQGIRGNPEAIQKQSQAAMENYAKKTGAIYKEVDEMGGTVSKDKAFMPLLDEIISMKEKGRISSKQADSFLESLNPYLEHSSSEVPVSLAAQWKTDAGRLIPQKAREIGVSPKMVNRMQKALETGLREGVENSVETTLGAAKKAELSQLNKEWGSFITVQNRTQKLKEMAEKSKFISPMDISTGLLGAGAGAMLDDATGNHSGAATFGTIGLLGRHALKATQSPAFLTRAGYYGRKAAESPWALLPDIGAREALKSNKKKEDEK